MKRKAGGYKSLTQWNETPDSVMQRRKEGNDFFAGDWAGTEGIRRSLRSLSLSYVPHALFEHGDDEGENSRRVG